MSRSHSPFLVDISQSRRSRVFRREEQLWREDLERLRKMIKDHIDLLRECHHTYQDRASSGQRQSWENDDTDPRPTLSLAVFGPAGSGKSSFLKTLIREVKKDDGIKAGTLPVLQPARFLDGDHLLYAFLAAALEAHRQHQKQSHGTQVDTDVLTPVQKAFQELSDDLRVIDQAPQDKEADPLGISIEKLQRHASGLRLRRKMRAFIDRLADDLAGEAVTDHSIVLLPVDDLDMAPAHLLPALRSLQAYLIHPRLVPIFTFTDRMAEEILRRALQKNVSTEAARKDNQRLPISEQLAVQFLAKCFPIRNRLRLGPAPATLQRADYRSYRQLPPHSDCPEASPEPVLTLLTTTSYLLFGHPDRSSRHRARAALHPSTLRRQFHVIDSMIQAGAEDLIDPYFKSLSGLPEMQNHPNPTTHAARKPPTTSRYHVKPYWARYFDRGVWALLNVHRDVLREFNLLLEDLYSWTPRALRRVLLGALFAQTPQTQLGLFQSWRSLTDSRRTQVISLLAVNAFRPWVEGENPTGDDDKALLAVRKQEAAPKPAQTASSAVPFADQKPQSKAEDVERFWSIPAPTGLLWFANLAVGFYLPQSLAWHRLLKSRRPADELRLSGSGWSLHSAPVHAALTAHDDQNILPTGMMFLNPFSYAIALTTLPKIEACRIIDEQDDHDTRNKEKARIEALEKFKIFLLSTDTETLAGKATNVAKNLMPDLDADTLNRLVEATSKESKELEAVTETIHDDQLLLRIWSCYGFNHGRYWAAASLWRGLGLIGQLIEEYTAWRIDPHYNQVEDGHDEWLSSRIAGILRTHSLRGLVPGTDLGNPAARSSLELAFAGWSSAGQQRAIWRLAERLRHWLCNMDRLRIYPFQDDAQESKGIKQRLWGRCLIRRLHGGYMIGSLWPSLDAEYMQHQGIETGEASQARKHYWTAGVALTSWIRVLLEYFKGCYSLRWTFESCPLVSPFLSQTAGDHLHQLLTKEKYSKFLEQLNHCRDSQTHSDIAELARRIWDERTSITREKPREELENLLKSPHLAEIIAGKSKERKQVLDHCEKFLRETLLAESANGVEKQTNMDLVRSTLDKLRRISGSSQDQLLDKLKASLRPRVEKPVVEGGIHKEDRDQLDMESVRYELASLVYRCWKLASHSSTASLFYQIPRVHRGDFIQEEQ